MHSGGNWQGSEFVSALEFKEIGFQEANFGFKNEASATSWVLQEMPEVRSLSGMTVDQSQNWWQNLLSERTTFFRENPEFVKTGSVYEDLV